MNLATAFLWFSLAALLVGALVYLLAGIRASLFMLAALLALFFLARWVANHAL